MRKNQYKYAKNAHAFGFKNGSPKRIFLIIHRYECCNEYSTLEAQLADQELNDGENFQIEGIVQRPVNFNLPSVDEIAKKAINSVSK